MISHISYFGGETTFLFIVVNQKLEPTAIVKRTFIRNGVYQYEHVGPAHVHFQVARFLINSTGVINWHAYKKSKHFRKVTGIFLRLVRIQLCPISRS